MLWSCVFLKDAAVHRSTRQKSLSEDSLLVDGWPLAASRNGGGDIRRSAGTDAAGLSVVDLSRHDDRPPLPDAGSLRSWRSRTRFTESPKWMVQCTARGRPGKQV